LPRENPYRTVAKQWIIPQLFFAEGTRLYGLIFDKWKANGNSALMGHYTKYSYANSNNFAPNPEEEERKLRCVVSKYTC
jgi:hypothetical protein